MPPFAARIHVLLARDAPLGVVIRRGPSKSVCTILWNRSTDEFTLGQWMRGRIYERRSDLSPDGKYMLYFAMNGRWESETRGAWTAISRAPYLKALTLLAKGDCWNGGGLFTSKRAFWLNDGYGHSILHASTEVRRNFSYVPTASHGGECPGVYYLRLERDGWIDRGGESIGKSHDVDTFEKSLSKGWMLRKLAHGEVGAKAGHGCYWDEHQLVHHNGDSINCPDWEWADLDNDRLVWASGGKLHAGLFRDGKLCQTKVLHDFNGMKFEAIAAPY
jgi:hypothetical protein